MALTLRSTFGGVYGHNATLRSVIEERSTNAAANTSLVNVSVYVDTNGYALFSNLTNLTLSINMGSAGGSANHSVNLNVGSSSSVLVFAKDYTITHDLNGSKSFQYTAQLNVNTGGYTFSAHTGAMTLATLARSSSVSAQAGTIGSSMTIAVNRKASYTHTLRYDWYGKTGTIATNVGTSAAWTPPMDFCNSIPNSVLGTCTIYVDTYSGSAKIGTNQTSVNLSVPSSVLPTLGSVSLSDSNTITAGMLSGASNTFIQILSRVKVAFNGAAGSYGSTITNYHAEIVGKNLSANGNGGIFDLLNFSGSQTIRATVTDSRGRTSKAVDVKITLLEYFAPVLSITGVRAGYNNQSVSVTRIAKIAPVAVNGVQKNTFTLKFKYSEKDKNSYTDDNGDANVNSPAVNNLSASKAALAASFPTTKSYDIIATLSDKFTSTEAKITIGTELVPLAIKKDRIGFGKLPEAANRADSAWEYYYNGKPIQNWELTSSTGRSPYNASKTVDLNTKTVNSFFSCNEPSNGPLGDSNGQFYVAVYSESDNYLAQNAIQKNTGRMFSRTRHNGSWTPWVEYALTSHNNLVNTNWTSTGVAGCYYRREGSVVFLKYDVTPPSNTSYGLGSIPTNLIPNEMFFVAPAHAQVKDANGQIQVGTDGNVGLFPNRSIRYHSQISWSL